MPRLRKARLDELATLTELCIRSTVLIGYDDQHRQACRESLTFRPADMEQSHICVAEADNVLLGAALLLFHENTAFIERLFVAPENARTGIGKALFGWALTTAHRAGAQRLLINCHPRAAGFYQRMGAREAHSADPSPFPGRGMPRFQITLTSRRAADTP